MKKNFVRFAIVIAIVLLVYNVLVFAIPFERKVEEVFWISWAFGMFAILVQFLTAIYAFKKSGLKSKFYGIPVYKMGLVYLGVQVITSMIFIIINSFIEIPLWIMWIIYVLILAICALGFIGADAYRDHIETLDKQVAVKTSFMKGLAIDASSLANRVTEDSLNKKLHELAELIKYSDPVTNDALTEIEDEIERKFTLVKGKVLNNEDALADIDSLSALINERNERCKLAK